MVVVVVTVVVVVVTVVVVVVDEVDVSAKVVAAGRGASVVNNAREGSTPNCSATATHNNQAAVVTQTVGDGKDISNKQQFLTKVV